MGYIQALQHICIFFIGRIHQLYLLAPNAGVAACIHSRHFDSTCATRSNAFNVTRGLKILLWTTTMTSILVFGIGVHVTAYYRIVCYVSAHTLPLPKLVFLFCKQ